MKCTDCDKEMKESEGYYQTTKDGNFCSEKCVANWFSCWIDK